MQSAQLELQDIAGDLEQINRKISYDPARIEVLNERISSGFKLMKKLSYLSMNSFPLISKFPAVILPSNLMSLSFRMGMIGYNPVTGLVQVKDKTIHFYDAYKHNTDYDNLKIHFPAADNLPDHKNQ